LAALQLDDIIEGFGGLVGLILALITLFTGARDAAVRGLEEHVLTKKSQEHLQTEARLAWALFAATGLLFLAGLPLWIRTLAHWSWSTDHSVRWVFAIVWILLVPLAIWQQNIARRATLKARPRQATPQS
jgi:hypothetical protein